MPRKPGDPMPPGPSLLYLIYLSCHPSKIHSYASVELTDFHP